jgi:hypothetical protein
VYYKGALQKAKHLLPFEKGFITDKEKKMNAVQIEAMLSEAGLCKSNSKILFWHLNQFFGKGKFESEHKRHTCIFLVTNFHLLLTD